MRLLIVIALLFATPAFGVTGSGVTFSGVAAGGGSNPGSFGTCTYGVDCYCDTVSDPNLLLCEDFENIDYYETTNWVAGTGSDPTHFRGLASDWYARYGQPDCNSTSKNNLPDAPTIGTECYSGTPGAECADPREYCSTAQGNLIGGYGADCWGPGINTAAVMDIQRDDDFNVEGLGLSLTGGHVGGGDVFSGKTHMAYRYRTGYNGEICAGLGRKTWTSKTEIGFTMAHAYSSNLLATGLITYGEPWKQEEWYTGSGEGDQWSLGMTGAGGGGDNNYFPYQPYMWVTSFSACQAALNNNPAVAHVGSVGCGDSAPIMGYTADGNKFPNFFAATTYQNSTITNFYRPDDFNFGQWYCHRAHISGMGTSSMEIKIWHGETLVIHISGIDASGGKFENSAYSTFWWDGYSNRQNNSGSTGLDEIGYRYRDNVHITNGPPVSCAAIGF